MVRRTMIGVLAAAAGVGLAACGGARPYRFVNYHGGRAEANVPDLRTDGEEFGRQLASVDGFILIHEFGNVFIDEFDLPVLGKEEDAADAVATVFLTRAVGEYAFYAAEGQRGGQAAGAAPARLSSAASSCSSETSLGTRSSPAAR